MEALIQSELPLLGKELQFQVEKITPLDFFYTDGTAVGSFLKITIHATKYTTPVYFFPNGSYWCSGYLEEDERRKLEGWLETVKSKKLNQTPLPK